MKSGDPYSDKNDLSRARQEEYSAMNQQNRSEKALENSEPRIR